MGRLDLFLKLYRNKKAENMILPVLYSLLATVISLLLFVKENNRLFFESQVSKSGLGMEGLESGFLGTEIMLGVIAVSALILGGLGGICLIHVRNGALEKSQVMMRMFGMKASDLILKSLLDVFLFGIIAAAVGFSLGYVMFLHFVKRMVQRNSIRLISALCFKILMQTFFLMALIIFGGNLYVDFCMMEKPAVEILYERKGAAGQRKAVWILMGICLVLFIYANCVFGIPQKVIKTSLMVLAFVLAALFFHFFLFFGILAKKRRKNRAIKTVSDLSFCFLCSRSRKSAVLAIVISVGTILLCVVSNIRFNVGGMLRNAYRDNMGYSIVIRTEAAEDGEQVKKKLDEMGIGYTYASSKLCSYAELKGGFADQGLFYALVIHRQTDDNPHFQVADNRFYAENYFASQCNLMQGQSVDLFGGDVSYAGAMETNQYLSLVSYNFIVNRSDWNLSMDDSWDFIFLVDASFAEEKRIEASLHGYPCGIESASKLIDALKELMADYLSVFLLLGELYFYFGLGKHFPLSIPIVIVTTLVAVIFVMFCCYMAAVKNRYHTGFGMIRDE